MKSLATFFILPFFAFLLSGCEGMGFNPERVDEMLTPNVDAQTTTRTWEKSADGSLCPSERETGNPPAFR